MPSSTFGGGHQCKCATDYTGCACQETMNKIVNIGHNQRNLVQFLATSNTGRVPVSFG